MEKLPGHFTTIVVSVLQKQKYNDVSLKTLYAYLDKVKSCCLGHKWK